MFQNETGQRWGVCGSILWTTFLFVPLLISPLPALARDTQNSPELSQQQIEEKTFIEGWAVEDHELTEHYIIDESSVVAFPASELEDPIHVFSEGFENLKKSALKSLDLIQWKKLNGPLEKPNERYNRRSQFGSWKRDRTQPGCYDARAEVLARSSLTPVTTRRSSNGRCVVVSGRWIDPYNGKTHTVGSEVSIDHMVPLKNAYLAGGWKWDRRKRCQYFNFTPSPDHLLAVGGPENSSKGDSSPADYMPPIRSYQCQYLKSWLSVKAVWGLAISATEAEAIRDHVHQLGCRESEMQLPTSELKDLRKKIDKGSPACGNASEMQPEQLEFDFMSEAGEV